MPQILPPTSKIGTLLRQLEEAESEAPTSRKATDEPSTPARETVEAPLETPIRSESPGTARTISLPPEGATAPSATDTPEQIAPTTSKIGPIGGQEGGVLGADLGVAETPAPPPAPQAPVTFEQFKAAEPGNAGKNYATYLTETGQQNVLDEIGGNPRLSLSDTGEISEIGGGKWQHTPAPSGGVKLQQIPQAPSRPNTASLQDYLNQGKTAAQWYAETGRQGNLDVLTAGATQPIPPQAFTQAGANPPGVTGPLPQAQPGFAPAGPVPTAPGAGQGQVLGTQNIAPSGTPKAYSPYLESRPVQVQPSTIYPSDFVGPVGPYDLQAQSIPTGAPPPTALPGGTPGGDFQAAFEALYAKDPAAADKFIKDYIRKRQMQVYGGQ